MTRGWSRAITILSWIWSVLLWANVYMDTWTTLDWIWGWSIIYLGSFFYPRLPSSNCPPSHLAQSQHLKLGHVNTGRMSDTWESLPPPPYGDTVKRFSLLWSPLTHKGDTLFAPDNTNVQKLSALNLLTSALCTWSKKLLVRTTISIKCPEAQCRRSYSSKNNSYEPSILWASAVSSVTQIQALKKNTIFNNWWITNHDDRARAIKC